MRRLVWRVRWVFVCYPKGRKLGYSLRDHWSMSGDASAR